MTGDIIGLLMVTITLTIHLIGTVWWAASITRRVEFVEKWITQNEHTAERLMSLEKQVDHVGDGINRIEHILRHRGS